MSRLVFAIGDVHGCLSRLKELISKCYEFAGDQRAHISDFILLGDYIDRGPESRQVIEFLMEQGSDFQPILGNHDQAMLLACEDPEALKWWRKWGGAETLKSYGVDHPRDIPAEHLEFVGALPFFVDDDLRYFVHAGVRPRVTLAEQAPDDLLWIRDPYPEDCDHGRFIVHGHTPLAAGFPELRKNRVNVDTGAVYGGPLTAAVFNYEQAPPIAFITDTGVISKLPGSGEDA